MLILKKKQVYVNILYQKKKAIQISNNLELNDNLKVYCSSIYKKLNILYLTGSRAIACVGIGNNLDEAEQRVENAVKYIHGTVRHRSDIGTAHLIQKRINHMKQIYNN